MSKIIFMKYLPPVRPKKVPKLKILRIYWNLTHVIFRRSRSRFLCEKSFLLIFTTCSTQIGPKSKSAQDLLKFDTFDISNMTISILMSKMIFIKYLPPVTPKFISELKVPRIYWNWSICYFKYADLNFKVKNNFFKIFTTC